MHLLFLDLETTGLDPINDHILEVGVIFVEVDVERRVIRRLRPADYTNAHADLTKIDNARVLEMHKSSGLWEVCTHTNTNVVGRESLRGIEEDILHHIHFLDGFELGKVMVAGYSPHFDLGFISQQMPLLRTALHHRVFDVSTLQTLWLAINEPVAKAEKDDSAKKHRALADCDQALRTFVAWLKYWHRESWEIVTPSHLSAPE